MRILSQCNGFLPATIGGAEVLSYHLLKELKRRGHEILVLAGRTSSDPLGPQTFDGIDLVRLNFDTTIASRSLPALRRLSETVADIVRKFKPDVLHLNDTTLASFVFRRHGSIGHLPRLLTLHAVIRPAGRDGLQARLAAEADRIVSVSHAQCDTAAAAMPEVRDKLSVIWNALPSPDLPPTSLPLAHPVLLCIGRLIVDKGFRMAVRAFAHLRARGAIAKLTIAGNGVDKNDLECLVRDLGLGSDVEFTDWVAPDRVPALINTATMVVVPSRLPEPFGLVALQAAQMGRPTIATAVGGLPEVVEHGTTGLLVEPDDEHALAVSIESLLADPAKAERLGVNARERARQKFDFGGFVDAYERSYAEAREVAGSGDRCASGMVT